MSMNRVTAGMLSGLICASFACAQLLQPVPPRASDPNGGRPQDIFLNQPGALEADRPRTAFERFEQSMSRASFPSETDTGMAGGTVSVGELRHALSRSGASLAQRALKYSQDGNHWKAIELLKKMLEDSASVGYARSLLGVEYLKLGDINTAITQLKEAVTLIPSLAANHSNLGFALAWIGHRTAGEQELREAIRMDGSILKSHFVLGVLLLDRNVQEAQRHLLLAQNEVPRAHLALAVYFARLGQTDAAQEALKEFVQSAKVTPAEAERWLARTAALSRPATAFGFASESSQ